MHKIVNSYLAAPAQVEPSCASTILRRLSSFLFSLPPGFFPTDTSRSIGRYKLYVDNALLVVDLLCSSELLTRIITDATPTSPLEVPDYDDDDDLCHLPQRQKKMKRKNRNNAPSVDTTPFHRLGVKVPSSNAEADETAHKIANNLKMILKVRQVFPCLKVRV